MITYYWCDTETDGLNKHGASRLLELVFYTASFETPYEATKLWSGVFRIAPEDLLQMDPYILKTHGSNGLLEECLDSTLTIAEAERQLLDIIPAKFKMDDTPHLAGSSVAFDHGLLEMWTPRLAARFAHRYLDVSTKKLWCRSLGMSPIEKGHAHRAAADIMESIEHGKKCDAWLEEYYVQKALHERRVVDPNQQQQAAMAAIMGRGVSQDMAR